LTVCIVNYNGERYLPETLAAVAACRGEWQEAIIIDNASTDRSLDLARERLPEARLLRLPENRGPGAARNAGFDAAAGDWLLFLDNDVAPLPGAIQRLRAALEAEPAAVLAMPRILYRRQPDTVQYDGAGSHVLGLVAPQGNGQPAHGLPEATREIDSLITACFLVARRRWRASHFFDDAFFFYLEDHELGLRARLLGGRILAVPAARCLHGEGTPGLSLRESGEYSAARVYYTVRNRWLVLLKLYQLRTLLALAPSLLLFEAFQVAGALKKDWLREWLRAARWVVAHAGEVLEKRRAFRRERRLPDRAALACGPLPFNKALLQGRIERAAAAVLAWAVKANWAAAAPLLPAPPRAAGEERA
jgi:GT2 family glycosyltransferase